PMNAIDPEQYVCPLCSVAADPDRWFTPGQIEYEQGMVKFHLTDTVDDELAGQFRVSEGHSTASAPAELIETNDMMRVEPRCHPWEPVKVPEKRADTHCTAWSVVGSTPPNTQAVKSHNKYACRTECLADYQV
ncbi:hypothetical protein ACFVHA_28810, partial [Bacillus cereus]|uniref:hypothetical protein n=1 Tax=Bacillus cereus TaxID=1396 RepID=UPI00362ED3F5